MVADADLPGAAIQLVPTTDRAAIDELLRLNELIDLCIPRGGEGLIRAVVEKSRIPVIKHYKGVCHVFVDRDADFDMAEKIVINGKCQRPGVCNAIETLLVDAPLAGTFLPRIEKALKAKGVEIKISFHFRGYWAIAKIQPTKRKMNEKVMTARAILILIYCTLQT